MAGDHALNDGGQLLEAARRARIEMCVFPNDVRQEGEVASLARLMYVHIPELARREGHAIREGEGHPDGIVVRDEGLVRLIASEAQASRGVSNWLAAITSPETKAMFGEGRDNAMSPALDRFAADRGFSRDDGLATEARVLDAPRAVAPAMVAHMQAMQRGR